MPRVEDFVRTWWRTPFLPWFTDHGVAHSQRVAAYAERIADSDNLPSGVRLSALERFILWSSAWLHDLGMQSLLGMDLGAVDEAGYGRVRHEHPAQSALVIAEHAVAIGLPPDDLMLHELIAYVARAHGTDYYTGSVARLRRYTEVRNESIRGTLLAAILLMADEMDLHYQRNVSKPAFATLNQVSEAHAFKHRCIVAARVRHDPTCGDIVIELVTRRSDQQTDDAVTLAERWVIEKLRKQIALTENEIAAGFRGHIRFSRSIRVSRIEGGLVSSAQPSAEVLAIIRSDLAISDTINHSIELRQVRQGVEDRSVVTIRGRYDRAGQQDIDGREDLLRATDLWLREQGNFAVASSYALPESGGAASCLDVLAGLHRQVAPAINPGATRDDVLHALEVALEDEPRHVVLLVSSLDLLPPSDVRWFVAHAVEALRSHSDVSFVFSGEPGSPEMGVATGAMEVHTGNLAVDDVETYLARYVTRVAAHSEAAVDGLTYAQFKRLRAAHLAGLEEEARRGDA
ncbi:HD domain-containing protein [Nocardioides lijunqiniae]|uniref:HD domain-containing protein n=1 Tax=Nocardioides lijunqiniae TaxID=2760832 RepID=UPI0018776629|nr:HD domain-containing protein [Nocardioides lijunqiniae]